MRSWPATRSGFQVHVGERMEPEHRKGLGRLLRDKTYEKLTNLRKRLAERLPEVHEELLGVAESHEEPDVRAALRLLRQALADLATSLRMDLPWPEEAPREFLPSVWVREPDADLETVLSGRLLWLPEVDLQDHGLATESGLRLVAPALARSLSQDRSLKRAWSGFLKAQDYRFNDRFREALAGDPDLPGIVDEAAGTQGPATGPQMKDPPVSGRPGQRLQARRRQTHLVGRLSR